MRRLRGGWLILGALLAAGGAAPSAEAEDRSVTIIEGVPEPVSPKPNPPSMPPTALQALRTDNPAGLHLEILPGADLGVGTDVAFHVQTAKAGYLILIDVSADNRATQIYPNVLSLARQLKKPANANLIKPGMTAVVPDPRNPLAQFTFRTEPPLGQGIIVAVLSEEPVQLVDLPELPAAPSSPQDAVDTLSRSIKSLMVARPDQPGAFATAAWSLSAVSYSIR